MTDLRELEKRLEEATECNQELDAALWSLWDKRPLEGPADGLRIYKRDPEDRGAFDLPPNYTASLDAAVALVERMGFFYRLQKETPVGQKAFLAKYWATVGPAGAQEAANAETGPVALMLALIRALIAKE